MVVEFSAIIEYFQLVFLVVNIALKCYVFKSITQSTAGFFCKIVRLLEVKWPQSLHIFDFSSEIAGEFRAQTSSNRDTFWLKNMRGKNGKTVLPRFLKIEWGGTVSVLPAIKIWW